jgi:hypothetical protein
MGHRQEIGVGLFGAECLARAENVSGVDRYDHGQAHAPRHRSCPRRTQSQSLASSQSLFFPLHPIPSFPSLHRIEFLSAKSPREFLRIRRIGEAVDVEPLPVVVDAMAARAERQILAEVVDGLVAAVLAGACRQRDVVRPAAIDRQPATIRPCGTPRQTPPP